MSKLVVANFLVGLKSKLADLRFFVGRMSKLVALSDLFAALNTISIVESLLELFFSEVLFAFALFPYAIGIVSWSNLCLSHVT